jgi:VanZ family protein
MGKRLFQIVFYIALSAVSVLAVLPDYDALPPIVSFSDLLNHAVAFFVLYLLLRCSHPRLTRKNALLLLFAYALLIEAVQYFLPTRFAALSDVAADGAGLLAALPLYPLLVRFSLCPDASR